MKIWPAKDPDEVLDYDVDWTWRLYSADELAQAQAQEDAGETVTIVPVDHISTSTFALQPGATLVADSTSNSTTATKVWLSGGTEGQTYVITNEITTVGGRTMDQSIKLRVKTK